MSGQRRRRLDAACQEKPSESHRLGNEAAQGRNALLDRRSGHQALGCLGVEPGSQFVPERVVTTRADFGPRSHPIRGRAEPAVP